MNNFNTSGDLVEDWMMCNESTLGISFNEPVGLGSSYDIEDIEHLNPEHYIEEFNFNPDSYIEEFKFFISTTEYINNLIIRLVDDIYKPENKLENKLEIDWRDDYVVEIHNVILNDESMRYIIDKIDLYLHYLYAQFKSLSKFK